MKKELKNISFYENFSKKNLTFRTANITFQEQKHIILPLSKF